MVLAVLGQPAIAELGIDAAVVFNAYIDAIFGTSEFWNWFVNLTIIAALLLSVLNALMGASRGLYQNAHDGILPKAFGWTNKHGAPSFAMLFSLVFSIAILCIGQILQIYIFSNMGYLFAAALSLVGYGIFRATRDESRAAAADARVDGPARPSCSVSRCCSCGRSAAGTRPQYAVGAGYDWHGLPTLFLIGLILLLLYFPLNWWRGMEDRTAGGGAAAQTEAAS